MTASNGNAGGSTGGAALRQMGGAVAHLLTAPGLRSLFCANSMLGMAMSFVLPFMSLFCTEEVGMSLHLFGIFMTVNALAGIVIGTWISHRSDMNVSRRAVLLWGSSAGTLAYACYAFVREPWLLFVIGSVVVGVASLTFSQLFALARELVERSGVPKTDVPLYMNAFRMAFALSWTIGPAVAAYTLKALSFTGLFCGASALYFTVFLLVFFYIEKSQRPTASAVAVEESRVLDLMRRRDVAFWFSAIALMLAAHTMSSNNMSLLVLRVLGGDESDIGVIFSLAPIFELPLMLYVGLLATRVRSSKLVRGAMLLAIAYYLGLACVESARQIYPLQTLSAAIVSVIGGIAITFFQDMLPKRLGAATNVYANAARIGSTSGYLAFGVVASRFGHRGTAVACAALALVALGLTALGGTPRNASD
jgi:SET family sugar efflux transporter-like MFS transporter